jgi:hypothetical protein
MTNPSPHHDPPTVIDSPRKRLKLSSPPSTTSTSTPSNPLQLPHTTPHVGSPITKMDEPEVPMPITENGFQPEREQQCAIVHFVNPSNPGFTGVLKQRYVPRACTRHPCGNRGTGQPYLFDLHCLFQSTENIFVHMLTTATRYTDFIVNEIALDGTVIHLTSDRAPKFKPVAKVSSLDRSPSYDAEIMMRKS